MVPRPLLLWACLTAAMTAAENGIAIMRGGDAEPYRVAETGLRAALAEHGLGVVAESGEAAVLVAIGSPAAAEALAVRRGQTLIYLLVADPDGLGLIAAEASHGVGMQVPLGEQFAIIAETFGDAARIGMLYRGSVADSRALRQAADAACPPDASLVAVDVDDCSSLSGAIDRLFASDCDVIWTAADPAVYTGTTVRALLLQSLRHRIPVFGFSRPFVRSGAAIGVGVDPAELGAQAAGLVARAIDPSADDPPPLLPPRFEIYVNRLVADKIRFDIPRGLLRRAEEVHHGR